MTQHAQRTFAVLETGVIDFGKTCYGKVANLLRTCYGEVASLLETCYELVVYVVACYGFWP